MPLPQKAGAFVISRYSGRRISLTNLARLLDQSGNIPSNILKQFLQDVANNAAIIAKNMILAGRAIEAASGWGGATQYAPLTLLIRNMEIEANRLPPEARLWYVNTGQLAESLSGQAVMEGRYAITIIIGPESMARAYRGISNTVALWNLLQNGASYVVTPEIREGLMGYLYALSITLGIVSPGNYDRFRNEIAPRVPRVGTNIFIPPRPLFVGDFLKRIQNYIDKQITQAFGYAFRVLGKQIATDPNPSRVTRVWAQYKTR